MASPQAAPRPPETRWPPINPYPASLVKPPRERTAEDYPHGNWKLIESYEGGRLELYNLKNSIGERSDLAGKMPEKARALRRLLADWRKAVGAQMPQPNPGHKPSK